MRNKLLQFFAGRNGFDSYSKFLVLAGCVMVLLSSLLSRVLSGIPSLALWAGGIAGLVYGYIRALSRNVYKRSGENSWYLAQKSRFLGWFRNRKTRFQQRKDFKFITCPSCKAVMRVPRGKGKVNITCRKCGNRFQGHT